MSDKPIGPGDLAVVVKPPICPRAPSDDGLGLVFRAETVQTLWPIDGHCHHCGRHGGHIDGPTTYATVGRRAWPLYRLKRFTPPEEQQDQTTEEEVTA